MGSRKRKHGKKRQAESRKSRVRKPTYFAVSRNGDKYCTYDQAIRYLYDLRMQGNLAYLKDVYDFTGKRIFDSCRLKEQKDGSTKWERGYFIPGTNNWKGEPVGEKESDWLDKFNALIKWVWKWEDDGLHPYARDANRAPYLLPAVSVLRSIVPPNDQEILHIDRLQPYTDELRDAAFNGTLKISQVPGVPQYEYEIELFFTEKDATTLESEIKKEFGIDKRRASKPKRKGIDDYDPTAPWKELVRPIIKEHCVCSNPETGRLERKCPVKPRFILLKLKKETEANVQEIGKGKELVINHDRIRLHTFQTEVGKMHGYCKTEIPRLKREPRNTKEKK